MKAHRRNHSPSLAGSGLRSSLAVMTLLCHFGAAGLRAPTARGQTPAATESVLELRAQQRAQEKARAAAARLVTGVLDLQLRQLAENGLQEREAYREISLMRQNIDALVQEEMQGVVRLLAAAEQAPEAERTETLQQARDALRTSVVKLMAERQRLYRRLKIARLAAEVRGVKQRQESARELVRQAQSEPAAQRQRRTVFAIEDQKDVRGLFFQLVSLLEEVRTWDGQLGDSASRGLRLLGQLKAEDQLRIALTALETAEYDPAREAQRQVIRSLDLLLDVIQHAQGLDSAGREQALRQIQQLQRQQQQLREETLRADFEQPEQQDALADRQREIHRQLGSLEASAVDAGADPETLQEAKASALESQQQLFQGESDAALDAEERVLEKLGALEAQLADGLSQMADRSADDLLAEEQLLEQTRAELQVAAESQRQAGDLTKQNRPQAAARQEQVAEQIEAAVHKELPATVESRLEDAAEAARRAAEVLRHTPPDAAQPPRDKAADEAVDEAVDQAAEALQRAESEVQARLADTRRRRLAVEVGELARASEALERAAAAEREVAADIEDADSQLPSRKARKMAEQQDKVAAVAADIAEGVRRTAPQVTQQLARVPAPVQAAQAELKQVESRPGDLSRKNAEAARGAVVQAAGELEQAAAGLRKQQEAVAHQLAAEAGRQLEQVARARGQVEAAVRQQREAPPVEAAPELERALNEIAAARQQQLRAAGRGAEADAESWQRAAQELQARQREAEQAARDLVAGRTNSPLEAANRQSRVAEAATAMARRQGQDNAAPAPPAALAAKLQQAAEAAEEAARQALLGDPAAAAAARQAAARAVDEAAAEGARQLDDARQQPSREPDPQAQQQASRKVAEAQAAAAEASQGVRQDLQAAAEASAAAQQKLADGPPQPAAEAQQNALRALAGAEQGVRDALRQAGAQAAAELRQQAQQTDQLAASAGAIDPAAAAALRQASQQALQAARSSAEARAAAAAPTAGADPSPEGSPPEGAPPRDPPGARAMDRALASLAAREQQIQRDFNVASTLADLAVEQEEARRAIHQQAEVLKELAPAADATEPPADEAAANLKARAEAANKLQEASESFANAQRATGQGAVAISQQQEVANVPIRRGLNTASELSAPLSMEQVAAASQTGGESPADPQGNPTESTGAQADSGEGQGQAPNAQSQTAPSDAQAGKGQPGPDSPSSGQPGEGQPGDGQPGEGQAGTQNAEASESKLGTGMVPSSPEFTAEQIAGAEALGAAEQALADAQAAAQPASSQGQGTSTPTGPAKGQPQQGAQSQGNGDMATTPPSGNPADEPGPSSGSAPGSDASDRDLAGRQLRQAPWFARLPPSLQKAVQARAGRPAPRGYEERLKNYFESID